MNFNQLGEAVLGDKEADRRLKDNIDRLRQPGVDYISIKLSAIVSQISLTGYQQTIDKIKPRLREIYRAAIEGGRTTGPKFVNLDMEEYRDLGLDGQRVSICPRRTGIRKTRSGYRLASLPSRLFRSAQITHPMGNCASPKNRRRHQGSTGQRGQSGHGAGRSFIGGLGAGALSFESRSRCQLQTNVGVCNSPRKTPKPSESESAATTFSMSRLR